MNFLKSPCSIDIKLLKVNTFGTFKSSWDLTFKETISAGNFLLLLGLVVMHSFLAGLMETDSSCMEADYSVTSARE